MDLEITPPAHYIKGAATAHYSTCAARAHNSTSAARAHNSTFQFIHYQKISHYQGLDFQREVQTKKYSIVFIYIELINNEELAHKM